MAFNLSTNESAANFPFSSRIFFDKSFFMITLLKKRRAMSASGRWMPSYSRLELVHCRRLLASVNDQGPTKFALGSLDLGAETAPAHACNLPWRARGNQHRPRRRGDSGIPGRRSRQGGGSVCGEPIGAGHPLQRQVRAMPERRMNTFRIQIDGQAALVQADSETSLFAAMARAEMAWPVSCRTCLEDRAMPHGGRLRSSSASPAAPA